MKIVPLGFTLSIFLAVTFTLCMIWGLLTPETLHMHTAWEGWLPGFNWSLGGYLVGLVWTVVYGWYAALVFAPLYNFFHRKPRS